MANCINIFLKRDCIILKIKDNSSREEIKIEITGAS